MSTVASRSAGPGTRANIDEFTETTAHGLESIGGAGRGKAIIILNPADPPILMRNTVYCALPAGADQRGHRGVRRGDGRGGRRRTCPATASRASRSTTGRSTRPAARRPRASRIFLEVTGNGDYLPPYAGNLDIMTASAVRVGETLAAERFGVTPHDRADRRRRRPRPSPRARYRLTDSTLRDGSHALRHQFTPAQVAAIAGALDAAGVPVIEVSHGDGLGGSSFNYGFSGTRRARRCSRAAAGAVTRARLAVLLCPGIGLARDLERGPRDRRVRSRASRPIARRRTSAIQHLRLARDLGMETVGFLMMSHMLEPAELLRPGADHGGRRRGHASTWSTPRAP